MTGLYSNGKIRIKEDDTRTGAFTADGAWRVENLGAGPFVTPSGARRKDMTEQYYDTVDETPVEGVTLTAGTDGSNIGFNDAAVGGTPFGSLSAEPAEGQTLNVIQYLAATYLQVYFTGDLSAYADTLTVTVDGVPYVGIDAALKAQVSGGFTMWAWTDPPVFVDEGQYTVSVTL